MKKVVLFSLLCLFTVAAFAQLTETIGIGVRFQLDSSAGYKVPVVIGMPIGSPAQQAGMQIGDLIISADGHPTRDLTFKEIIALITGPEGTTVNIAINRKGTERNFTIARKKYKSSPQFYLNSAANDEFCNAITTLMNDAPLSFSSTADTVHFTEEKKSYTVRHYPSLVSVPGTTGVDIRSHMGTTAVISLGNFKTEAEASAAGEPVLQRIKRGFPGYYYNPMQESNGTATVEVSRPLTDGFEEAILCLSYSGNEKDGYNLYLNINGDKLTHYYSIKAPEQNTAFTKAVLAILNDVPNNFKNIKGTLHKGSSSNFAGGEDWYGVSEMPEGASQCGISNGFSLGTTNPCQCNFYKGDNEDDAQANYLKVANQLRSELGPTFCYSGEKQPLDMAIPENADWVTTFGIKKGKRFEEGPVVSLVLVKNTDNTYQVQMLFHNFGL